MERSGEDNTQDEEGVGEERTTLVTFKGDGDNVIGRPGGGVGGRGEGRHLREEQPWRHPGMTIGREGANDGNHNNLGPRHGRLCAHGSQSIPGHS